MTRRILVTGGSGFVGGNLSKKLVERAYQVNVLYQSGDDIRLIEKLPVQHFTGDICDVDIVWKALQDCDYVFHTVGNMSFWPKDRQLQYKVNVEGTKNIIRQCQAAGVKKLIITSSINALGYPPLGKSGNEETAFNWEDLDFYYALTKKKAQEIALAANTADFAVVAVNPGTIFGPGDINFNGGTYIREVKKGKGHLCIKGGTSCVHIEAVVNGHLAALKKGRGGEKYILGGENLSYKEIFEIIAAELGYIFYPVVEIPTEFAMVAAHLSEITCNLVGQKSNFVREAIRAGSIYNYYDSNKAIRELSYQIIPFRQAVRDAIKYYQDENLL